MRTILILAAILWASTAQLAGQNSHRHSIAPSQNAAIGSQKEDSFGWRVFEFDDGRFKVALPAEPTVEIKPIESGIQETKLYSYTSEGDTQIYLVGFVDFGFALDGFVGPERLFDSWEEGITESTPNAKVTRREIDFEGSKARHVVIDNGDVRSEAILQIIEGRMIQLVVVSAVANHGTGELENSKLVAKFFESFEYTAKEAGNSGTAKSDLFKSEEYGFEITLPAGWLRVDGDVAKEAGREYSKADPGTTSKGRESFEKSFDRTEMLFTIAKSETPGGGASNLICAIERIDDTRVPTKAIAEASYREFITNLGYSSVSAPVYVELNGVGFYMFRVKKVVGPTTWTQWIHMKKVKGKILQFVITENNSAFLTEMQNSLDTLSFDKN